MMCPTMKEFTGIFFMYATGRYGSTSAFCFEPSRWCFSRRALIKGLLWLLACAVASAQVTQVNISQDLVQLGIASQNAVPNSPSLDTRPLLQAAIQYAADNGIAK